MMIDEMKNKRKFLGVLSGSAWGLLPLILLPLSSLIVIGKRLELELLSRVFCY